MADLIYRRDAYDVVYKEHCGICTGAILDIPKVEAIPIDWLYSQMKNNPNDIESAYDDICISELIEKWKKEQESKR